MASGVFQTGSTAEFACASLERWWKTTGKQEYPQASELLLFADCGCSHGYKNRLWKYSLQQFANRTGLRVHVCHYPPGTSNWNNIEHAMFSLITINWRAKPLTLYSRENSHFVLSVLVLSIFVLFHLVE